MTTSSLGKRIEWLREQSIRLDQSSKDGKILMSTESMSRQCKVIAEALADIERTLKSVVHSH